MTQLKIKDAMDAVEELKKEIKTSSCDGDCQKRIEAVENAIKELKKELRQHLDVYNKHIVDLHING